MALKIVRTVAGARRFQQPKGSIIVRDGSNPLDALVGLPNDREGYEKVADANGAIYYVGVVEGKWVVESGVDGSKLKEFDGSEAAFEWLNQEVGGAKAPERSGDGVQLDARPDVAPGRARDRLELQRSFQLSVDESAAVQALNDNELAKYRQLRQRGLGHLQAYRESRESGQSGNPHKKGKKYMDTDLEYKRQFSSEKLESLGKAGKAFKNHNGEWSYPVENEGDLKNAIRAIGRCAPEDRNALIRYLKRRASALGKTDLIPDQWSGQKDVLDWAPEEKVHGHRTLERAPGKRDNWVEIAGRLPPYIEHIAQALHERKGFTISRAIATAISRVKRWAAGLDNVTAKTRAKAIKAVAQWTALKAKNKARRKK